MPRRRPLLKWLSGMSNAPFAICAFSIVFLQGCALEQVNARRLGAQWNALNISRSTEAVGKVPQDWTAGVFISTPVLERFANLAKDTEISYVGSNGFLEGTKIV